MMRTSLSSSVSFARLRCVRVSMYSFLVFWMKVSAVWSVRLSVHGALYIDGLAQQIARTRQHQGAPRG